MTPRPQPCDTGATMASNGPVGERNLWVEITDGTVAELVQLTFLRAGDPRPVAAVDIDGDGPRPIVGLDRRPGEELRQVPAWACEIEESGSGMAWVIYGGNAGVAILGGDARTLDDDELAALQDQGDPDAGDHDFDGYLILDGADLVLREDP